MPPLADIQREFAHAILNGTVSGSAFVTGPVSATVALQVHRNTIMGALSNALRLSFPTVSILVGERFFDQAACAFVERQPPAAAKLSAYGAGFPEFLRSYAPATSLPYLGDVAELDWIVDRALLEPVAMRRFKLDAAVSMELPLSMKVLRLATPADLIKSAIRDEVDLAAIDMAAAPRWLLVWRRGAQAAVRVVGAVAATFIASLQAGDDAEAALAAAAGHAPQTDAFMSIQNEIFAADFCHIISIKDETS